MTLHDIKTPQRLLVTKQHKPLDFVYLVDDYISTTVRRSKRNNSIGMTNRIIQHNFMKGEDTDGNNQILDPEKNNNHHESYPK